MALIELSEQDIMTLRAMAREYRRTRSDNYELRKYSQTKIDRGPLEIYVAKQSDSDPIDAPSGDNPTSGDVDLYYVDQEPESPDEDILKPLGVDQEARRIPPGYDIVARDMLGSLLIIGMGLDVRFGKANKDIAAGSIIGEVNLFEFDETNGVMKATAEPTLTGVKHLWMHGGQQISQGKEVVIFRIASHWHVLMAECE